MRMSKSSNTFFSKKKRNPFIGCLNFNKRQRVKCTYYLDLTDNFHLNVLNSKKGIF